MNAAVGSAAMRVETESAPNTKARPLWFGADARPRFGWIHPAAAPVGNVAIVIVPPFGYEAICAHRSLRHLADQAAQSGMLAVRFDADGCGDSAGGDLDPGRVDAWLASVGDACDVARSAGAESIILAGVRMGAMLALVAASRRDDVAGVAAIALPTSGKAFLREGRALQMALGLKPPPGSIAQTSAQIEEIVGFALTAETRTQVSALAADALGMRPAPKILLLDRDDMPGNVAWAERLRSLGAEVSQQRLPGYVEMVLDAQNAQVPGAIIAAVVAFARSCATLAAVSPQTPAAHRTRVLLREGEETISEEAVAIDDCVRGIASGPADGRCERAVVLLNAGAVGRVGPNRLHVRLARRLAAAGTLVLRLDQSGIGDSDVREGGTENCVYSDQVLGDVAAAVRWVRSAGARHVSVAGLCSGAYHALQAAIAGQPIDSIVVINPLTFAYKPGMPLDAAAFRTTAEVTRYGDSLRSASAWRKLLRGEVELARVVRTLARRSGAIATAWTREALRALRIPLQDDLAGDLNALARRGVAIRFIFASDDPGRVMLAEQGGGALRRLVADGRVQIDVIEGSDHTFTPLWSHEPLLDAIAQAVR
ncbi:MAG: hypothetical protein ABI846_03245 [Rudaea sp.]